ncbi:hypothetical protein P3S68_001053 [Capsicum galapagoense]
MERHGKESSHPSGQGSKQLFSSFQYKILQHAKPLSQIPLVGLLFIPPVNLIAVGKVAVRAATNPVFPPDVIDVHEILRCSQQRTV